MGKPMDFKYSIVVLSCVCISFLYGISFLSHPIAIEFTNIENYEGKQVILQGIITDYTTTKTGNQIITIQDQTASNITLTIFVEGSVNLNYGDMIQAHGTIEKYKEIYELVVNNPEHITILTPWQNSTIPIRQLAEQPHKYLGLNIHVNGYVERILSDCFYLTDSDGTYFIPVYSDTTIKLKAGDSLSLGALFLYDNTLLRYKLHLCDENHFIDIPTR